MFIDTECEGKGATHHHACKCREAYFKGVERKLEITKDALDWIASGGDTEGKDAVDTAIEALEKII